MLKGYTLPLTPNGTSSLAEFPPWHYVGNAIAVEFEVDPKKAARFLPDVLKLESNRCVANFVEWQYATDTGNEYLEPIRSQYREATFLMSATLDGKRVSYCPFIFVDQAESLMRGLIQGLPKQQGSVWITRAYDLPSPANPVVGPNGKFAASIAANDRRIASATITLKEKATSPIYPNFSNLVTTRHFPELAIGKHSTPAVFELAEFKFRSIQVSNAWKGEASLELPQHPSLELHEFSPTSVVAGYRYTLAATVDDLVTLRDLRK